MISVLSGFELSLKSITLEEENADLFQCTDPVFQSFRVTCDHKFNWRTQDEIQCMQKTSAPLGFFEETTGGGKETDQFSS